MQAHRSAPWPAAIASPGTRRFDDQRELLLELVVDPPAECEPVAALAARLRRPRAAILAAGRALASAGLAEVEGGGVRASAAARAFDTLLPARM